MPGNPVLYRVRAPSTANIRSSVTSDQLSHHIVDPACRPLILRSCLFLVCLVLSAYCGPGSLRTPWPTLSPTRPYNHQPSLTCNNSDTQSLCSQCINELAFCACLPHRSRHKESFPKHNKIITKIATVEPGCDNPFLERKLGIWAAWPQSEGPRRHERDAKVMGLWSRGSW